MEKYCKRECPQMMETKNPGGYGQGYCKEYNKYLFQEPVLDSRGNHIFDFTLKCKECRNDKKNSV